MTRITEAYIKEIVTKDYNDFYNKVYDGYIPPGIMEKMREGLFGSRPIDFQGPPELLKALIRKKDEDLQYVDMGVVVNTIFYIPLSIIHSDLDSGLDYTALLYRMKDEFNARSEKFNETMKRKQQKLMELGGLSKAIQMPSIKN